MEWRKGEPVDLKHLQSSLSIALKLAKFRPPRALPDSDEVCARAAKAILENLERSGMVIVHAHDKLLRTAEQCPPFSPEPRAPYKRCEACDD